ncbi:hypothetical protein [Streptomyces parvus]|uniref:hypothetical protein n=1 Tax=Streptomyces parvus TaxID=66428 RepID=UPI003409A54A
MCSTYAAATGTRADDDAPLSARRQANGSCWDVRGKSETPYEYRVVTTDRYGKASRPGPPARATTPDTRRPAPVGNPTAERVPLGVRLTWTDPATASCTTLAEGTTGGAAYYMDLAVHEDPLGLYC